MAFSGETLLINKDGIIRTIKQTTTVSTLSANTSIKWISTGA